MVIVLSDMVWKLQQDIYKCKYYIHLVEGLIIKGQAAYSDQYKFIHVKTMT